MNTSADATTDQAAPPPADERPHLVLVGGGHAHVLVLREFARRPPPARLTVVLDVPRAVYSGMVPGFVAGQYRAGELEIDVVALARAAGAEVVLSPATGVAPERRTIAVADRAPIGYDLASFDVGSTVSGLDTPGVRDHAVPTRPIRRLVAEVERLVERSRTAASTLRVVVVGGGAGGVELAFTLQARLESEAPHGVQLTLIDARSPPLSGFHHRLAKRLHRHAKRRGINVCSGQATRIERGAVILDGGERVGCDLVLWVTGAAPIELFDGAGLALDEGGFVLVRSTLQVLDHDDLFAAGDCASMSDAPTPKAGVYAVRQAPRLAHNLRAMLAGKALRRYRPQRHFLMLLNLGDGTAIGCKRGLVFEGRSVMALKDAIDRRFVERFRIAGPDSTVEGRAAGAGSKQRPDRPPQGILASFAVDASAQEAEPISSGHIHRTWRVTDRGSNRRYVLQWLNPTVFPSPLAVGRNVELVTTWLRERAAASGVHPADLERRTLRLVTGRRGETHVQTEEGAVYRMFDEIPEARTIERVGDPRLVAEAARAFGAFQELLSELDPGRLEITIERFHDTPHRFEQLDAALRADPLGRAALARPEIAAVAAHRHLAGRLLFAGLPARVVHNDAKLANVLFDQSTGEALCVIDLDTVMPGLVAFDFGDMVRSMSHRASEDAVDAGSVTVDLELFGAIASGYLGAAAKFLTVREVDTLFDGALVMVLQQCVRFLTDYLAGDRYFAVQSEQQNLDRARVHLALLEDLLRRERELRALIAGKSGAAADC